MYIVINITMDKQYKQLKVNVTPDLAKAVKLYCVKRDTTLSKLITDYLSGLVKQDNIDIKNHLVALQNAPSTLPFNALKAKILDKSSVNKSIDLSDKKEQPEVSYTETEDYKNWKAKQAEKLAQQDPKVVRSPEDLDKMFEDIF